MQQQNSLSMTTCDMPTKTYPKPKPTNTCKMPESPHLQFPLMQTPKLPSNLNFQTQKSKKQIMHPPFHFLALPATLKSNQVIIKLKYFWIYVKSYSL